MGNKNSICCRGCGFVLPPPFLDLGTTPLANSYVSQANASKREPVFPLAVAYCAHCHLVQLTTTVSPAQLFSEYLYFSSYSESYLCHARDMVESLCQSLSLTRSSVVVEIASNDGYLLRCFQKRGMRVLGIEPARNIADAAQAGGIPTWNRFFGLDVVPELLAKNGPADIVIGNNVFAHIPDVNEFLLAVRACLKPGGTAVLEFPSISDLLTHREFDTIYHEHVFYFSLSSVAVLADRAGFCLADVEHHAVHGGSLRVFLTVASVEPSLAVREMLRAEGEAGLRSANTYGRFSDQVTAFRSAMLDLLVKLRRRGRSIAAYGAPAKGNTLLNYCGIDSTLVQFTVDRSPHKQGLLLPGSRIPIEAPEELSRRRPDYALILPWNIAPEIVSQQHEYLQLGGQFIIPIPVPRIVGSFEESHKSLQEQSLPSHAYAQRPRDR